MILFLFSFFSLINAFNINMCSEKPPPLWNALSNNLKNTARIWFIDRAKKSGIDWDYLVEKNNYKKNRLEYLKDISTDYTMVYPTYYTQPFHGYDDGNLNWLAALEGEAATINMAVGYWKQINPLVTQEWLRYNVSKNIKHYLNNSSLISQPKNILDVGCSVGISSEFLFKSFRQSHITGIDLSPYFIAMAKLRAEEYDFPITYFHRNAEHTKFDNNKFDLIVCNFIMHELPEKATNNILNELYKKLTIGGTLAIVDLSPVELNEDDFFVSKFKKWAFEVTEPHIYGYYNRNMISLLSDSGFINIQEIKNDPMNSIWVGSKPSPY